MQAAAQGHNGAIYNVAILHERGLGVAQSDAKAAEWFQKSTDKMVQNKLGKWYEAGRGVNKSTRKAAEWYSLSAHQGYKDAQTNLGILYRNGNGVTQNFAKAAE